MSILSLLEEEAWFDDDPVAKLYIVSRIIVWKLFRIRGCYIEDNLPISKIEKKMLFEFFLYQKDTLLLVDVPWFLHFKITTTFLNRGSKNTRKYSF